MEAQRALEIGTEFAGLVVERVLGTGPYDIDYLVRADGQQRRLKEFFPAQWSRRDGLEAVSRDPEDRGAMRWWLRSFLDRWQVASQVRHPGFVQVFRVFEANATGYALTESVPGETLDELLERGGALEASHLKAFFAPLLPAVAALQASDLSPLDLGPERLRLRADGGLCLTTISSLRAPLRLHSGLLMTTGRPPYLAPEQLRAGAESGVPADLYALAAIIYRAVSGRDVPDAAQRTADAAPVPLSEASGGRCPAELASVVDAALGLQPATRPELASMRVALGVSAETAEQPAETRAASVAERRRLRPAVIVGVAATVIVAAVLWWWLWPSHGPVSTVVPPLATASRAPAAAAPAVSASSAPAVASTAATPPAGGRVGLDQLALELLKKQQALNAQRAAQAAAETTLKTMKPSENQPRRVASKTRSAGSGPGAASSVQNQQLESEVAKLQDQLTVQRIQAQAEAAKAADLAQQQQTRQQAQQQAAEQAKKQQETARQAAAARLAAVVAKADKTCALPAPKLSVNNNLTYGNAMQVPGARKMSGGAIRLPPVRLPDGTTEQFEITQDSCAHQIRY